MTKILISRRLIWPGLSQDVRRRTVAWREKRRGLLKLLPIPDRIWSELSIDFVSGLPLSGSDKATEIMVITDRLSKNVIFEPMVFTIVNVVADRLLRCLIRYYGLPRAIVLDRGP